MKKALVRWPDGQEIRGKRIIAAFRAKKLIRYSREVAGKAVCWFARCEAPGCQNEYNFSRTNRPGCRKKRCEHHLGKSRIEGRVYSRAILAQHPVAKWVRVKHGLWHRNVPYFQCQFVEGCAKLVTGDNKDGTKGLFCRAHGHQKLRPYEATYNLFLANQRVRNKTRLRPIEINLRYEDFVKICLYEPNCFYCNKDVGRVPYTGKGNSGVLYMRAAYLDRLDVAKGYSKRNVVTCCGICNMTRNVYMSVEEMLVLAQVRAGNAKAVTALMDQHEKSLAEWSKKVRHLRKFGAQKAKRR